MIVKQISTDRIFFFFFFASYNQYYLRLVWQELMEICDADCVNPNDSSWLELQVAIRCQSKYQLKLETNIKNGKTRDFHIPTCSLHWTSIVADILPRLQRGKGNNKLWSPPEKNKNHNGCSLSPLKSYRWLIFSEQVNPTALDQNHTSIRKPSATLTLSIALISILDVVWLSHELMKQPFRISSSQEPFQ